MRQANVLLHFLQFTLQVRSTIAPMPHRIPEVNFAQTFTWVFLNLLLEEGFVSEAMNGSVCIFKLRTDELRFMLERRKPYSGYHIAQKWSAITAKLREYASFILTSDIADKAKASTSWVEPVSRWVRWVVDVFDGGWFSTDVLTVAFSAFTIRAHVQVRKGFGPKWGNWAKTINWKTS